MGGTLLCILIVSYFIPAIIAMFNGHRHMAGIMLLNIFLGWTLVGWVVALVWSVTSIKIPQQQVVVVQQPGPPPSGALSELDMV